MNIKTFFNELRCNVIKQTEESRPRQQEATILQQEAVNFQQEAVNFQGVPVIF